MGEWGQLLNDTFPAGPDYPKYFARPNQARVRYDLPMGMPFAQTPNVIEEPTRRS